MPALSTARARARGVPTGVERRLGTDDLIVTKTDLRGHLTYCNDTFVRVTAADEHDVMGRAHNLIRHPDMPGGVFRLMWDRLTAGEEIFAYVVNLALDGQHYWVLAHVTPTYDSAATVIGYHSTRRSPSRSAIAPVTDLYARMRTVEQGLARHAAAEASLAWLQEHLASLDLTYEEWLWSLEVEL